MPRVTPRHVAFQHPAEERIFTDQFGRSWSAVDTGEAVVFTCTSDGRQSGRAIAVDHGAPSHSVGDETLRAWLEAAPRIGMLS